MSEKFVLSCPKCTSRIRLPNPRLTLGKEIRCPKCFERFVATEDAAAEVTPPVQAIGATRRKSAAKPRKESVFHEYGAAAKPLGDPRSKPARSSETLEELPPPTEKKPRKKKRKKSREVPEPSGFKMCVGGFAGGSLGGVVWIAFAYFLRVHLGIVAILVGVLTGIGVQTGNSGQDEHGPGEIAVFTAFGVILVCKYVVGCLLANHILFGEEALKAFSFYDIIWCAIAGRWAYRVASGGLY